MTSFSKIASLANLPVSDFDHDLEETIKYVDILREVETKEVKPTAQVGNSANFFREDEIDKTRLVPAGKYTSKISWT